MKTNKKRNIRMELGKIPADLIRRYFNHDVGRDSAALTYYLLFAIFPLLIFVSTLLGVLDVDIESTVAELAQFVPAELAEIVRSYLEYVSSNTSRQLLWFSLIFSVWFPMRATSCLMHSVRKAFGRQPPESILWSQIRTLIFTVLLIVTIAASLVLSVVGRRALQFISTLVTIPIRFISIWSYMRFVLLGLIMFVLLVPLYMLAQGQRRPMREVVPGVIVSLVAWMVLSLAFSYYVEHLAHYTELYGSIAAIVVAMLWLYISGTVLIMGAEFSAVIQERKQKRLSAGTEE